MPITNAAIEMAPIVLGVDEAAEPKTVVSSTDDAAASDSRLLVSGSSPPRSSSPGAGHRHRRRSYRRLPRARDASPVRSVVPQPQTVGDRRSGQGATLLNRVDVANATVADYPQGEADTVPSDRSHLPGTSLTPSKARLIFPTPDEDGSSG